MAPAALQWHEGNAVDLRSGALLTAGSVAVAAACHQTVRGVAGVHEARRPDAERIGDRNLDSELRFYAVWYGIAGAQMLRAAT
ncbi:MAG: hypothetical protein M3P93_05215, partial [Actinomycetota bacterium]|nr:hypothetical protein [Actinomycetota bacterium]